MEMVGLFLLGLTLGVTVFLYLRLPYQPARWEGLRLMVMCQVCEGRGYTVRHVISSESSGLARISCDACDGEGVVFPPKKEGKS